MFERIPVENACRTRARGRGPGHGTPERARCPPRRYTFPKNVTVNDERDFWSPVTPPERAVAPDLQKLVGAGADLWDSDEEFTRFVEGIRARRAESRAAEAAKDRQVGHTA